MAIKPTIVQYGDWKLKHTKTVGFRGYSSAQNVSTCLYKIICKYLSLLNYLLYLL